MKNDFLKAFEEFHSHIELGMGKDIQAFLEGGECIKKYNIKANEEETVVINIILHDFSFATAKRVFLDFVNFVGYSGVNLFICNDMKNKVEYLYLTTKNNSGIKMEILIE